MLCISAGLEDATYEQFRDIKIVYSLQLYGNMFITVAIDNIQYNPLSITLLGSFHGTGSSLIQHSHTSGDGRDSNQIVIDYSSTKFTVLQLCTTCLIKAVKSTIPAVVQE